MSLRAFAPISIGNFIVGFDVLGAAVQPVDGSLLGDIVEISDAAQYRLEIAGPYAGKLPANAEDNIVHACHKLFHEKLRERDVEPAPLKLRLEKCLPVGSGLGSSAASIVAALYALNEWYGRPYGDHEVLRMTGAMEAQISGGLHYDNVAPSLRGGLQLMVPDSERISVTLPLPANWHYVLYYPGIEVSTRAARAILPREYPLGTVTAFAERLACFISALHSGDAAFAAQMMHDEIAEPYRATLVPGFSAAKAAALSQGALAFGLSGSGPTCLAVCPDRASAERVALALDDAFPQQTERFRHVCQIDTLGARVLADLR